MSQLSQPRGSLRRLSRLDFQRLNHPVFLPPQSHKLQTIEKLEGYQESSPNESEEQEENSEESECQEEEEEGEEKGGEEEHDREKGTTSRPPLGPRISSSANFPEPFPRPVEVTNTSQPQPTRITISEDRTSGSDYTQKQLLALKGSGRSIKSRTIDPHPTWVDPGNLFPSTIAPQLQYFHQAQDQQQRLIPQQQLQVSRRQQARAARQALQHQALQQEALQQEALQHQALQHQALQQQVAQLQAAQLQAAQQERLQQLQQQKHYQSQHMAAEQHKLVERSQPPLRGGQSDLDLQPPTAYPHPEGVESINMTGFRENGAIGFADPTYCRIPGDGAPELYESRSQDQLLINRVRVLEQENVLLNRFINPEATYRGPPFSQVLYRFKGNDKVFLRRPRWARDPSSTRIKYILTGDSLSMKAEEYFKRTRSLAFVVFKTYALETVDPSLKEQEQDQNPDTWPIPDPEYETISFVSSEMRGALLSYLRKQPNFGELFPQFDLKKELDAPYLFWYCYRSSYETTLRELSARQIYLMNLFVQWITPNYEDEYTKVDEQLSRGVIHPAFLKYLVRPGDVLVESTKKHVQAYMAKSWTTMKPHSRYGTEKESQKFWDVEAWSYQFDGTFYRLNKILTIEINGDDLTGQISIKDLNIVPIRYTDQGTRTRLEKRGRTYWECRNKRFISCRIRDDIESLNNNNERFMIDFPTYKQLHPDEKDPPFGRPKGEEIPPERMEIDEPPAAPELFLFPPTIIGFNLRRKKWVDLEVDLIQKVEWNKRAFESLVVEEETKVLVQALVTNRLEAENGTDMIEDKGNGLTILLHGGPGTGKTFTAESVAEMAEKPLYRVTCGDIGTRPEEVEQYLESALHLGKIWDCVVLLDEADVFLQERTLSDLKRNALVTVFLRVLEYYDGILILTSNRVGTFDEAFKSRIQLALHYPNLSQSQRFKIWRNLINRLKRLEQPNIDFDDVECYMAELAEKDMNGRQIRNAITTARQLAKFKGKKMTHAHLKHVIDVASKFDTYLSTVKEGFTDDDIARESGFR